MKVGCNIILIKNGTECVTCIIGVICAVVYVVTGGLLEIGKTYPDVHFLFMNNVTYS